MDTLEPVEEYVVARFCAEKWNVDIYFDSLADTPEQIRLQQAASSFLAEYGFDPSAHGSESYVEVLGIAGE